MNSEGFKEEQTDLDERVQDMQDELNSLRLENINLLASLATVQTVKETKEKILEEIRAKLEVGEKENARLTSHLKRLEEKLNNATKELEQARKRFRELDALFQDASADNNKLTEENRALSEQHDQLIEAEIALKTKLRALEETLEARDKEIENFNTTFTEKFKRLQEEHELCLGDLEQKEKKAEEKLSSQEAEMRGMKKKIMDLEDSLKDERDNSAKKDEEILQSTQLVDTLRKALEDSRRRTRATLGRCPRSSSRRALDGERQPQSES